MEGEEKRSERVAYTRNLNPALMIVLIRTSRSSSHDNPNYAGPDYNISLQQP